MAGPAHLGKVSHGELSADAWRVVVTVHFPITLGRLQGGYPVDSVKKTRWIIFQHLVQGALLATWRSTSPSRWTKADTYLRQYLTGLVESMKS